MGDNGCPTRSENRPGAAVMRDGRRFRRSSLYEGHDGASDVDIVGPRARGAQFVVSGRAQRLRARQRVEVAGVRRELRLPHCSLRACCLGLVGQTGQLRLLAAAG